LRRAARSSILHVWRLAVVVLVACAARPPYRDDITAAVTARRPARQIAAPVDGIAPRPWKVGQWALYKIVHGDEVVLEKLAVVAEDTCGIWIEQIRIAAYRRWSVKLCFRAGGLDSRTATFDAIQLAIAQRDDEPPQVIERADRIRRARIFPVHFLHARWRDDRAGVREDVHVDAGVFAQASRVVHEDATLWFHPDVPFGGIVRGRSSGGTETTLLDYGGEGAASAIAALARPQPRRPLRMTASLGIGFGGLTGAGDAATTNAVMAGALVGYRLTGCLDLAVGLDGTIASDAGEPGVEQRAGVLTVGLQWYPFRAPLYVRAGGGLSLLARGSSEFMWGGDDDVELDGGLTTGGAVGLALRGPFGTYAVEAREHVLLLHDGGTRHAFGVFAMLGFP
jgi:hypothetical protein